MDGALTNPFAHAGASALAVAGADTVDSVAGIELELYRANAIESDDTSSARLRLADGTVIAITVSLCSDRRTEPYLHLHGDTRSARLFYTLDEIEIDGVRTGFGRVDLLGNLLTHIRDGADLLVPLARTGGFTRLLDAIRLAPNHARSMGGSSGRNRPGWSCPASRDWSSARRKTSKRSPSWASPTASGRSRSRGRRRFCAWTIRRSPTTSSAETYRPPTPRDPTCTPSGPSAGRSSPRRSQPTTSTTSGRASRSPTSTGPTSGAAPPTSRTRARRSCPTTDGSAAARSARSTAATRRLDWVGPDGTVLAGEERTLTARPVADAWALDFAFTLTGKTAEPLVIQSSACKGRVGAGYGGFFWRAQDSLRPGGLHRRGVRRGGRARQRHALAGADLGHLEPGVRPDRRARPLVRARRRISRRRPGAGLGEAADRPGPPEPGDHRRGRRRWLTADQARALAGGTTS